MKATWDNKIIAESPQERLIFIEGNWYFPRDSVKDEWIKSSSTRTNCPWKGEASYFNIVTENGMNADAAWYYPKPKPEAITTVGNDFTDYVSFWRGVEVTS